MVELKGMRKITEWCFSGGRKSSIVGVFMNKITATTSETNYFSCGLLAQPRWTVVSSCYTPTSATHARDSTCLLQVCLILLIENSVWILLSSRLWDTLVGGSLHPKMCLLHAKSGASDAFPILCFTHLKPEMTTLLTLQSVVRRKLSNALHVWPNTDT